MRSSFSLWRGFVGKLRRNDEASGTTDKLFSHFQDVFQSPASKPIEDTILSPDSSDCASSPLDRQGASSANSISFLSNNTTRTASPAANLQNNSSLTEYVENLLPGPGVLQRTVFPHHGRSTPDRLSPLVGLRGPTRHSGLQRSQSSATVRVLPSTPAEGYTQSPPVRYRMLSMCQSTPETPQQHHRMITTGVSPLSTCSTTFVHPACDRQQNSQWQQRQSAAPSYTVSPFNAFAHQRAFSGQISGSGTPLPGCGTPLPPGCGTPLQGGATSVLKTSGCSRQNRNIEVAVKMT